ncbi:Ubiquitin carboxyl-terminal hydrolase 43 [Saguinus oedipus]|uniref:Ubiquitin carboxyl-terminal hydrolase 43 n=1 Tax=Saguinus oedipus TaxID=9490 RepID=A0ABQ9VP50_SAGOE|nr:Ubiquitin carboxyl-terminal hydrolase 43 [Saguinus oedipus]
MAPHVAQRSTSPEAGLGPWPSWKQPGCLPTSYPLDFLYDLYAVCNHHGNLQGGHYTAMATASRYPQNRCCWDAELPGALSEI